MEMICSEKIYQHVIYLLIAIISVTSIMTVFPIPEGWLCQWASASIKTKYTNTVTFLVDNKHIIREISILSMS